MSIKWCVNPFYNIKCHKAQEELLKGNSISVVGKLIRDQNVILKYGQCEYYRFIFSDSVIINAHSLLIKKDCFHLHLTNTEPQRLTSHKAISSEAPSNSICMHGVDHIRNRSLQLFQSVYRPRDNLLSYCSSLANGWFKQIQID